MSASTDAELERLLDAYGDAERWSGEAGAGGYERAQRRLVADRDAARIALLAHLAAYYRRVSLPEHPLTQSRDGGEWSYTSAVAIRDELGRPLRRIYRDGRLIGETFEDRFVVPWRPGMPTPEEAIRRLRDGADTPETEHWPDPPIVAGPKRRIPVTIRAAKPEVG